MTTTLTAPEGRAPTGVRCGNHRLDGERRHASASEVRACYARRYDQEDEARAERAVEAATERFFEERGYHEARDEEDREARDGVVSFSEAMAQAEAAAQLLDQPAVDWDAIRAIPVGERGYGFYALPGPADQPAHYRVERPTTGPGAGRTFVLRLAAGSASTLDRGESIEVLEAIAADPEAAGALFTESTGNCRDCNRFLRIKSSVDQHRGPKCARKHR
jgi:uncharacterized protein DUF6011